MKYEYPLTNSIVFALVMRDPRLCRGFLQLVFPERQIREVRIHEESAEWKELVSGERVTPEDKRESIEVEKTLIVGIDIHKVRLDVLFSDSEAWYDIEMQARDEHNLPKRTRYVHGILDTDALKPGQDYDSLPPSYVIFICCFDCFGADLPIYCFSMMEEETHLPLGDESYTIILNSKAGDKTSIPEPMRQFLNYLNEQEVPEGNDFLEEIDRSVQDWNTGRRRELIMTLEQQILIRENKAREQGIEQGREEERERNEKDKRNSAKKLKTSGVVTEIIADSLGLTIEEVDNL